MEWGNKDGENWKGVVQFSEFHQFSLLKTSNKTEEVSVYNHVLETFKMVQGTFGNQK